MRTSLIVFMLLLVAPNICLGQFTPQYESYVSYSADEAGNIYQTVVVDGTTTGSCNFPCNWSQCRIPNCPSEHTPSIYNVIGGIGGWSSGEPQTMFAYTSYQVTNSIAATDGQDYAVATDGKIFCATAGSNIFSAGLIYAAIGYTVAVYKAPVFRDPNGCTYALACPGGSQPSCGQQSLFVNGPRCTNPTNAFAVEYGLVVNRGTANQKCYPFLFVKYFQTLLPAQRCE